MSTGLQLRKTYKIPEPTGFQKVLCRISKLQPKKYWSLPDKNRRLITKIQKHKNYQIKENKLECNSCRTEAKRMEKI
jgi:hypothetical protein